MRTIVIMLLLITSLAGRGANASSRTPEAIVQDFYATLQKTLSKPLSQALRSLSRFLSRDLNTLIAQAQKADDAFLKKNPNDKPFLGDGTCFFYGGGDCDFSSYRVTDVKNRNSVAEITVELTLIDPRRPNDPPYTWKDLVTLKKEKGKWVIQDIEYFGEKASRILKDDIEEVRKELQE